MYDYDLELVKALTNTTAEVRGRLARYWGRQAEQVQIEAVKFAFDLLRQSGIDNQERLPEVFYCCLSKALGKMHHYETARAVKKKSDSSDSGELRKISEIRIARLKASKQAKSSPRTSKLLLQYGELVMRLRSEGYGWRRIADYLRRYHRQKVSHQTLYNTFREGQGRYS
jgi:hypothetical protein